MKIKKTTAIILSLGLCLPMLTACGNSKNNEKDTSSKTSNTSAQESQKEDETKNESESSQESKSEESKTEESTDVQTPDKKMHTLLICDSLKNDSMTATFSNSISGATEDIVMTKSKETDDGLIYTCQADTEKYNMVHLNYGNKLKSKDVAFNSFVAGWYLKDDPNFSYDPLLPYAEGLDLKYDPSFETAKLRFRDYEKTIYIWTPADYDAKSSEKYSTIYTFDGQSVLTQGLDRGMDNDKESWNIAESVTGMMSVTDNKAIIVSIVTDGESRENELIPDLGELYNDPDMPDEFKIDSKKFGNEFADFVCDTVMPYIQHKYNVYTDAKHNALVGSSLGGLETFYTVLAHPDKFSTGGVMSATFGVYDEKVWNSFLDKNIKSDNAPFLYFYAGSYGFDNGDVMEKMYITLAEKNYPQDKIVYNKYERGTHLILFWRNVFSEFLQAFFMQRVEALDFGAEIEYKDRTDMRNNVVTEIKIDENDPRLKDKNNFVYYDNSETKWENVYAFWWGDESFSTNIITGGFYETGWPGMKMEQIEGTDIYRIVAPEGAGNIIFDSGITDDEVKKGVTAYQTRDIVYKVNENTGMVYKIDLSQKPKKGKGSESTKFVYLKGSWSEYNG